MSATRQALTLKLARSVLGVTEKADAAQIRRAFREHAKRLHPDHLGGDGARFREMTEAYKLLLAAPTASTAPAPVQPTVQKVLKSPRLVIPPGQALTGGAAEAELDDGRRIRVQLSPGMRAGEKVRAAGVVFDLEIAAEGETLIRGHDLWMTAKVEPATLADGGRVAVETPLGRRIVWITKAAGRRRLIRLEGQGLPARGRYPQGHLFLRLAADGESRAESAARTLLRKFTAAWAA